MAGFAFFAVIQLASVHLASHYAVDGYVSIIVTVALWALAKPLAEWVAQSRASREPIGLPEPDAA